MSSRKGERPVIRNCWDCHKMEHACYKGHSLCLEILVWEGYNPNEKVENNYALIQATKYPDSKCFDVLLQQCKDLDYSVKNNGITALGYAIIYDYEDKVEKLLRKCVVITNSERLTSDINLAIALGRYRILKLLLKRKPTFNYELALFLIRLSLRRKDNHEILKCEEILLDYIATLIREGKEV